MRGQLDGHWITRESWIGVEIESLPERTYMELCLKSRTEKYIAVTRYNFISNVVYLWLGLLIQSSIKFIEFRRLYYNTWTCSYICKTTSEFTSQFWMTRLRINTSCTAKRTAHVGQGYTINWKYTTYLHPHHPWGHILLKHPNNAI